MLIAASVGEAQMARRGGEFIINSFTTGNQREPRLAALPDGGFMVAWDNEGQVATRRFNSESQALEPEIQINKGSACFPPQPSLAAAPNGSALVAWCAVDADGTRSVEAKRLDAHGNPQGEEFRIASERYQGPDVAALGEDQFVVTWTSYYAGYGRVVQPHDLQPAFRIAPDETQYNVAVDGYSDDSFRVLWYDGGGLLLGRSFEPGEPPSDTFEVARVDSAGPHAPVLCTNTGGEFVVSWATYGPTGQDVRVSYRRFSASGGPLTKSTVVTPEDVYPIQLVPAIACGPAGRFAITWQQVPPNPNNALLRIREFTGDSQDSILNVTIALSSPNQSGTASLAYLTTGDLLIAWHDCSESSGCDIIGQRFTAADATVCPGDCNMDGEVGIAELITIVNIVLNSAHPTAVKACLAADADPDYVVTVGEQVLSVRSALEGCR